MDHYFPEDIMFQILMRLPVLSLLRFRCASKFWYDFISSPRFIKSYFDYNHKQVVGNDKVLFTQKLPTDSYTLRYDNQNFKRIKLFRFPYKDAIISGCINGLLCLRKSNDRKNSHFMLWNPSIRKVFVLPEYNHELPLIDKATQSIAEWVQLSDLSFGFGYDVSSNDYKVVKVCGYGNKLVQGNPPLFATRSCVGVFNLSTKSWKTVDFSLPIYPFSNSCNVGRFVYRLSAIVMNHTVKIFSFDWSSEVFEEIDMPPRDRPVGEGSKDVLVVIRDDTLAFLRRWDYLDYDIWAMKEDGAAKSWTKLYSVHLGGGDFRGQHIAGFTKKGVMVVVGDENVVVSATKYDLKVAKYVAPKTIYYWQRTWQVNPFKESLFLLNEGVDVSLLDL